MKSKGKASGISLLILLILFTGAFGGIGTGSVHADETPSHWLTFKYDNFSGLSLSNTLSINNNAGVAGTALRLTPALPGKTGSVFNRSLIYSTNNYSFSTFFSFQLTGQGNDPGFASGADGITFTIQTQSSNAGTVGSGIGYAGISPSFGIKFDTFRNPELSDPSDNYIGLAKNGNVMNVPGWYVDVPTATYDMKDGQVHYAWIDYDGAAKKVEVRIANTSSRPAIATLTVNSVDLNSIFNGQSGVFAGFTSATGSAWENHDLLQWYFTNKYDPIDPDNGNYLPAPTDVDVTPEPYGLPGKTVLIATAKDPDGNPVAGVPVTFDPDIGTIDDYPGGFPLPTPAVVLTGPDGTARVVLDMSDEDTSSDEVTVVTEGGAYTTVQLQLPDAPLSAPVISDETMTGATLSWDAASGADSYSVYDNGVPVRTVAGTSVALTDLDPTVDHSFTFTAIKDNVESKPSPSADLPARIVLNGTDGTLTVSSVDPSVTVSVYDEDENLLGSDRNDGNDPSDVTVGGLDVTEDGQYKVTLTDGEGQPVDGSPFVVTPRYETTGAPQPEDVSANATSDTVTVANVPPGATVGVYDKTTGDLLGTAANSGESPAEVTVSIDGGLTDSQQVQVKLKEPLKTWSDPVDIVARAAVPSVPADVRAVAGDGAVDLSWQASDYATGYKIYMRTATGDWGELATVDAAAVSYEASGLTNGAIYYFKVVAIGEGTDSGESAAASAVPTDGSTAAQPDKTIGTVAGTGEPGYSGDGGPAASAQFNQPSGVGLDEAGDLYIADTGNHVVRRIDKASGTVSTVAGTGTAGYSGDGGDALAAQLNAPADIATSVYGSVYIADTGNNAVRKLDLETGIITTVAGVGTAGYSGDGGSASAAELSSPRGIAVDGEGNLYIADTGNNVIRKVDFATGVISTIAGTGAAGYGGDGGDATAAELNGPTGVAVDREGNLYIADSGNHTVRKIDGSTGRISTIAGTGTAGDSGDGGPATLAELGDLGGIDVDGNGNVYIVDSTSHRVREIDAATGTIRTVAGNGSAGYGGDGGDSASAQLNRPTDVAVDDDGNVYIADSSNDSIREVEAAPTNSPQASDITADGSNNRVIVRNVPPGAVVRIYDADGNWIASATNAGNEAGTVTLDQLEPPLAELGSIKVTVELPGHPESAPVDKAVTTDSAAPNPADVTTNSAARTVTVDRVPPGATVTVYDDNGQAVGHAVNDGSEPGPVTVSIPEDVQDGAALKITIAEAGKPESAPTGVTYQATEEQELAEAAKRLQVGYTEGDTWESITSPVYLATAGAYGTDVSWSSSDPNTVSVGQPADRTIAASVTRQSKDTNVILTATLTKNGKHQTKTFLLVVKAAGSTKEVDSSYTRNAEVKDRTNASTSVPITRIRVTYQDQSVAKIDKVVLTADKAAEVVNHANSGSNEATIVIDELPEDAPDEIAVEVPADSVALLANDRFKLNVQTVYGTVTLDAAQLGLLNENGQSLFFRLVPVKNEAEQAQVKSQVPSTYDGKLAAPLGVPLELETNYSGYATDLFIPFARNGIDPDRVNVDSLRVYIRHTDGEKVMSEGTVAKDDDGHPIGLAVTIDKFSTFTFVSLNAPSGSSSTAGTSSVPVQVSADGSDISLPIELTRTTNGDGTVTDSLTITGDLAKTAVEQAQAAGKQKIVLTLPDSRDEVSAVSIRLDSDAAARLAEGKIDIEFVTANGSLLVPASSLANSQGAVGYTLTPVKDAQTQQELLSAALRSVAVQQASANGKPTAVGRPLRLTTGDAAWTAAVITLPLTGIDVPADEGAQAELLKRLAVYADYSNGQGELLRGKLVRLANGQYGLQVSAAKAGAYTVLNGLQAPEGQHSSYIKGYPDGTFRPDRPVTRAEMAAMLARNLPDGTATATAEAFSDVKDEFWAADSIAKVAAAGIMQGDPDGRFRPNDPLTREETAALAAQYLKLAAPAVPGNSRTFEDVKNDWSAAAIDAAYEAGAMKGYPDGTFQPKKRLTRAEAVSVINELFHRGPLYGLSAATWSDVPQTYWAYGDIEEASVDHGYLLLPDGGEQAVK